MNAGPALDPLDLFAHVYARADTATARAARHQLRAELEPEAEDVTPRAAPQGGRR